MACMACASTSHWECFDPDKDGYCCCPNVEPSDGRPTGNGSIKNAADMIDPMSTGRKRAALAKVIAPGQSCEWAMKKFAGGGAIPIVGCMGNNATSIHHGPDKDVLNNDDDNLNAICGACHNRWHSLNDQHYGKRPTPGTPFVPVGFKNHSNLDDTKASLDEVINSEAWWITKQKHRPEYVNLKMLEKEAANA